VDFAGLLRMTWQGYIRAIVNLVLFTIVGFILCLTIVLIPTVAAGWVRGVLGYVREDREPRLEELWSFDDYLPSLLLLLVSVVLIGIGYALLIVPGVVLHTWWLYSLFFLVDRKLTFLEAMEASRQAVIASGFWNHLVLLLIVSVLQTAGGNALGGLGALLTTPFSLLLVTLAYEDLGAEESQDEREGEGGGEGEGEPG
jgi:uncharacterized membrane protein